MVIRTNVKDKDLESVIAALKADGGKVLSVSPLKWKLTKTTATVTEHVLVSMR